MEFFELKSFYIVTDIKEHQENKLKIIRAIDAMPQASINDGVELTSKTDWNIPQNYQREYLDIFYDMIKPYLQEMTDRLRCKECRVSNTWYQVYNKGDKHDWHTHPEANYTNVYYLSLPNKSMKTQLYDVVGESIVENIEVEEGQILTFPASVIHRSPVNEIDESNNWWPFKNKIDRKIVISFNSNFNSPVM